MRNWRDLVDPTIKDYLEALIRETTTNKEAYGEAGNKGDAQLWVAMANLSKQIFNLNLRLKYMEKLMKDFMKQKAEQQKVVEVKKVVKEKPKVVKKKIKKKLIKKRKVTKKKK